MADERGNRQDDQQGPGRALVESLTSSEGLRSLQAAGRAARDSAEASGLVGVAMEELPLLKWIAGGHNAVAAVRDRLLLEKIALFLEPLEDIDEGRRRQWAEELERDPGERERVGSHLMLTLDRLELPDKATLLGIAFSKCIRGEASQEDFRRVARIIDLLQVEDLWVLVQVSERELKDLPGVQRNILPPNGLAIFESGGPATTALGELVLSLLPRKDIETACSPQTT